MRMLIEYTVEIPTNYRNRRRETIVHNKHWISEETIEEIQEIQEDICSIDCWVDYIWAFLLDCNRDIEIPFGRVNVHSINIVGDAGECLFIEKFNPFAREVRAFLLGFLTSRDLSLVFDQNDRLIREMKRSLNECYISVELKKEANEDESEGGS